MQFEINLTTRRMTPFFKRHPLLSATARGSTASGSAVAEESWVSLLLGQHHHGPTAAAGLEPEPSLLRR